MNLRELADAFNDLVQFQGVLGLGHDQDAVLARDLVDRLDALPLGDFSGYAGGVDIGLDLDLDDGLDVASRGASQSRRRPIGQALDFVAYGRAARQETLLGPPPGLIKGVVMLQRPILILAALMVAVPAPVAADTDDEHGSIWGLRDYACGSPTHTGAAFSFVGVSSAPVSWRVLSQGFYTPTVGMDVPIDRVDTYPHGIGVDGFYEIDVRESVVCDDIVDCSIAFTMQYQDLTEGWLNEDLAWIGCSDEGITLEGCRVTEYKADEGTVTIWSSSSSTTYPITDGYWKNGCGGGRNDDYATFTIVQGTALYRGELAEAPKKKDYCRVVGASNNKLSEGMDASIEPGGNPTSGFTVSFSCWSGWNNSGSLKFEGTMNGRQRIGLNPECVLQGNTGCQEINV